MSHLSVILLYTPKIRAHPAYVPCIPYERNMFYFVPEVAIAS